MADIFTIPEHIISGDGAVDTAILHMETYGNRALLVTDAIMVKMEPVQKLIQQLTAAKIECIIFDQINGEPTDTVIIKGVEVYRQEGCEFLIAIGGGSAMDAMKAIGIITVYGGRLSDLMGKEIETPLPPMVAIPTTAGTGSEVTQFAIITDTETETKMLLKGRAIMPDMAVIVPEYSVSTPTHITASTGLDALTHAIEAYTSRKAQPLSDVMALSAVKRIVHFLPIVYADGRNLEARNQMALGALEAGIAFQNSSVTLIHGMSRPIGALFHVPHGISNAMLLSTCLSYVCDGASQRFSELGHAIGVSHGEQDTDKAARCFIQAVENLCQYCNIPTLEQYGVKKEIFFNKIPKMTEDAIASGSPANTRRVISSAEIETLYRSLW